MNSAIDRRGFVTCAAAMTAAVAAQGATAALAKETKDAKDRHAPSLKADSSGQDAQDTLSTDILVVGAGLSGLAAAVEAANEGAKVILAESQDAAGGNGLGVEGTFGVGTELQKEQGIDVKPADIVRTELSSGQWRSNGLAWLDFIDNSSDNFQFMLDSGVKFSGKVDNYKGGLYPTMHWFDGSAGESYVPAMLSRAQELGVDVRFGFEVNELVTKDSAVTGAYAMTGDGRRTLVNAKAVILATGGFGSNKELIAELGYDPEKVYPVGTAGHDGLGYKMALSAGGVSVVREIGSCLSHNLTRAFPHDTCFEPLLSFGFYPKPIWVNQEAKRFVPEDFALSNVEAMTIPVKNQTRAYMLLDETILTDFLESNGIDRSAFDSALSSNEGNTLFSADTVKGAADAVGLDPDALEKCVEEYNAMCDAGSDTRLGKSADYLQKIQDAPFYIARMDEVLFVTSIGGIKTDRDYSVVNGAGEKVPGLFAIGNDGNMLYQSLYTIDMPGTCSGNCVNSGRIAARAAVSLLNK